MTRADNQRIQQIAKQAVSLGVAPASTPAWKHDAEFGRNNSMLIWDAVSALRSGKQAPPPVPRNSPHPTPPPRREPERDLPDDDDDVPPETPDDDGDNDDEADDDDACACVCEECRAGRCEDCSNPTCDDPNCGHDNSNH
jgi:hypothetical protein